MDHFKLLFHDLNDLIFSFRYVLVFFPSKLVYLPTSAMTTPTWATAVDSNRPLLPESPHIPPRTFSIALHDEAASSPNRVQYISATGEEYTLSQFYQLARSVGKACLALGMQPFDGAGILGFNAVPWFAADVGVTLAGGVSAGIYTTNKPDVVAYILNHSRARVMFVDDEDALQKALSCKQRCDALQAIVVWGTLDMAKYSDQGAYLYSWDEFLALGKDVPDQQLDERMRAAKPENIAKLIYTSGTTGPPKAVMISHDNITFTVKVISEMTGAGVGDQMVSFLPASHIAANAIDVCGALLNGTTVTLARPDALRGSLVETLKKVRPTIFLAVPRVFEKIQEKMLAVGASVGPVKRAISKWAKGVGTNASLALDSGEDLMPWGYELANMLVFRNVQKALGLDRCKLICNAAAPLQKATDDYFRSLNFRIYDIYGMSEATGPLSCNYPAYKRGTSGKVCPGMQVRLHNVDPTGEGELCFKGRNIFVGYMGKAEETESTIDGDSYIHSGDLGRIDEEGFITITGRAKELIVTAGGENVAPSLAESTLISAIPAISRAFAVGDHKKFVSCLLVPYMDDNGMLIGPATKVNPQVTSAEEAAKDETWDKYIEEGMERANEYAMSSAARVRKYALLTKDFAVETGELTPTMKVKRKIVVQNFAREIDAMYAA